MKIETPDVVDNHIVHEDGMTPGAICREYSQNDETGDWKPGEWFVVVSGVTCSRNSSIEFVYAIVLTGCEAGKLAKKYPGDMGVKPPHRGVTEKHEIGDPVKIHRHIIAATDSDQVPTETRLVNSDSKAEYREVT